MVQIKILDTGKYDIAETVPTGTDERAYGSAGTVGTALTLHIAKIKMSWEILTSKDQTVDKTKSDDDSKRWDFGEVDQNGVATPVWRFDGVWDMTNTDHKKDYGRFCHMCMTKGYKKIQLTTADATPIIGYRDYGAREADSEGTKTITEIKGRIVNFEPDTEEKSGGEMAYKFTFHESR